jgi:hypothetical protein
MGVKNEGMHRGWEGGDFTQMRTVLSLEEDAMYRLSGDTSTANTISVWPEMSRPLRVASSNTRS